MKEIQRQYHGELENSIQKFLQGNTVEEQLSAVEKIDALLPRKDKIYPEEALRYSLVDITKESVKQVDRLEKLETLNLDTNRNTEGETKDD